MTKPRCIGRIARVRNGRLVTRRKVWDYESFVHGGVAYKWHNSAVLDDPSVTLKQGDLKRGMWVKYKAKR